LRFSPALSIAARTTDWVRSSIVIPHGALAVLGTRSPGLAARLGAEQYYAMQ
jgi:hypothetical protein